ncbi:hypothetical protein CRG98_050330 [Punica granatum]|nr:hypothetical protein CRG98_050330 [Punica granatum]
MRTEVNTISKSSWPKVVVRKWLNMRSRSEKFHSDCTLRDAVRMEMRRKSCSDQDRYVIVPEEFSEGWLMEASNGLKEPPLGCTAAPPATGTPGQDLR